jgi:hypothetical protein
MDPTYPRLPGVCYAATADGVELPVIDITHPAFALALSDADVAALQRTFFAEATRRGWMPGFLRRRLFRWYLGRSVLGRGLMNASGGFLSGMNTYLMKLGPKVPVPVISGPADRRIAASFPATMLRLRLQDTAGLLAEGLAGPLAANPGSPLRLLAVGGGHAAEGLNTLILSQRADLSLLEGRRIHIQVLDLESDAPMFGQRALAALAAPGAPLEGLDADLEFIRYDWSDTRTLRTVVSAAGAASPVVAVATEGALFEYGSDADIVSNLAAIGETAPPGAFVVGSVTRENELTRRIHGANSIPVIPRGLVKFGALANAAGWTIERAVERAFSDTVRLRRA